MSGTGASVPRVFISSSLEDLRPYREMVRDAVIAAGMLPVMMEYFASGSANPPLAECLERVRATDLVVTLAAHRYGWVPPDQTAGEAKSITWLECEAAVQHGLELVGLVVDDGQSWPEDLKEMWRLTDAMQRGSATPELFAEINRNVARLKQFKHWLNERRFTARFTNPEDVRGKAFQALTEWRKRHPEFAAASPQDASAAKGPANPERYLRALLNQSAYLDIRGLISGAGRAHRFSIEDLYISLTTHYASEEQRATGGKRGKKSNRSKKRKSTERDSPSLPESIQDVPLQRTLAERCVVIVGDPGAGKTTFVRRIVTALCQTELSDPPNAAQARLGIKDRTFPLFLRAGELAAHIGQHRGAAGAPATDDSPAWLAHRLATQSHEAGLGLEESFFREQLSQGRATVLLDGLDEAPDRLQRESLARLVEQATNAFPHCRFVVTTRPAAYTENAVLPGFVRAAIDPLSDEAVETFLRRWCELLFPEDLPRAGAHCAELLAALRLRQDIRRMARNPVMLTALAVVHWNERRLPEQRADLYQSILKWLAQSREQNPRRERAERCLAILQELALRMQDSPKGRQVQVPRREAAEWLATEFGRGQSSRHAIELAEQFLLAEEEDSGIIVSRGTDVRFWHLTFQEYLAAKAIAARADDEQRGILWSTDGKIYHSEWREVMLLYGGVLHQQGRAKVDTFIADVLDKLGDSPKLPDVARCVSLLGGLLADLKPVGYATTDVRYGKQLDAVMAIFDKERSQSVPLEQRIQAADALGQAGDPRLEPNAPGRWIEVPGDRYWRGAQDKPGGRNHDPEAGDDESPVHEVVVGPFLISRYPATVAEYRRFVEHGGYDDERLWKAGGFKMFTEPDEWRKQLEHPNRPVVGISWFEASAYAAWEGARLPTEAEWEWAARRDTARRFPWGGEDIDKTRANFEMNVGAPTPVGIYPRGGTPDGIQDLAGNVWEWCQDWFGPYPTSDTPVSNPTGPANGNTRVLRGGSWGVQSWVCRAAFRFGYRPGLRDHTVGCRLCRFRQDL